MHTCLAYMTTLYAHFVSTLHDHVLHERHLHAVSLYMHDPLLLAPCACSSSANGPLCMTTATWAMHCQRPWTCESNGSAELLCIRDYHWLQRCSLCCQCPLHFERFGNERLRCMQVYPWQQTCSLHCQSPWKCGTLTCSVLQRRATGRPWMSHSPGIACRPISAHPYHVMDCLLTD